MFLLQLTTVMAIGLNMFNGQSGFWVLDLRSGFRVVYRGFSGSVTILRSHTVPVQRPAAANKQGPHCKVSKRQSGPWSRST